MSQKEMYANSNDDESERPNLLRGGSGERGASPIEFLSTRQ